MSRRNLLFWCWMMATLNGCQNETTNGGPAPPEEFAQISVMSFNVLYSSSNDAVLETLRETAADLVGLQEISSGRLAVLAQGLGYYGHHFTKTSANLNTEDTGVLSRFPIERVLQNGVVVKVNPGLSVAVFTVHLSPYPYQPYELRDQVITTSEQAITSASSLRLPEIMPVLEEIEGLKNEGIPVFLTGDFNEPSHLDWTEFAATKNMHFGLAVEWPVSKRIVGDGFTDAYRALLPNSANFPGNTWTTIEASNEVYDRIDIIYHLQVPEISLQDVRLAGGPGDSASIIVDHYPSDHYAVVATYGL